MSIAFVDEWHEGSEYSSHDYGITSCYMSHLTIAIMSQPKNGVEVCQDQIWGWDNVISYAKIIRKQNKCDYILFYFTVYYL